MKAAIHMYMYYCVVSFKMHHAPFSVYKSLRPKYFTIFVLNKTGADGMSFLTIFSFLAPVVQKVDYIIHRINHYPLDCTMGFPNTYLLDSDLTVG